LPPVLANMAQAMTELGRWPVRLTGPLVLAAASAALGRGVRVKSYDGHETRPNLYMMVAKESGSGGTSAFRLAFAPLYGYQALKRREFTNGLKPILESERSIHEAEIDYLRRQARQKKSTEERRDIGRKIGEIRKAILRLDAELSDPCFVVGDATTEGMTKLLSQHGETLCHADSDAADAISSILGRYSDGKDTTTESLWLKAYTGEQVIVARKKEGLTLLDEPCLSVIFLMTPSKLRELFSISRLCEAGLLPRFLVCDPHCKPSKIPEDVGSEARTLPSQASQPYEAAIFACLNKYRLYRNGLPGKKLPDQAELDVSQSLVIDMEPEARKLLVYYFNSLVEGPSWGPFEARIAEQAIKLALTYHVFSCIEIEQRGEATYGVKEIDNELPPLGRLAMEAGLGLSEWFSKCQEEFLSKKREEDRENVYFRFYQRFARHPFFTVRDLYSASGLGVPTAVEARKFFKDWESRGLIERLKGEENATTGRRKLPRYRFTVVRGKFG
jgi:Protein of unknown function (DUF3987)